MTGGPINESGIYDVGEAGRERVYLPRGANVMSAGQVSTMDAMAGLGGGAPVIINLNVKVDPTVNLAYAGRKIADALEAHYRSSGSRRAFAAA
jgi:SLT domain-containing protein